MRFSKEFRNSLTGFGTDHSEGMTEEQRYFFFEDFEYFRNLEVSDLGQLEQSWDPLGVGNTLYRVANE